MLRQQKKKSKKNRGFAAGVAAVRPLSPSSRHVCLPLLAAPLLCRGLFSWTASPSVAAGSYRRTQICGGFFSLQVKPPPPSDRSYLAARYREENTASAGPMPAAVPPTRMRQLSLKETVSLFRRLLSRMNGSQHRGQHGTSGVSLSPAFFIYFAACQSTIF